MVALFLFANIYIPFVFGVDEITERTLCLVLKYVIYKKKKVYWRRFRKETKSERIIRK